MRRELLLLREMRDAAVAIRDSQPGRLPSNWYECWMSIEAETAAVRRVDPGNDGLGWKDQIREPETPRQGR
jgi:hypothetical protein